MPSNLIRPSDLLHPARWEALMQNAMNLWFRTTRRRLRRALHANRHGNLRCGTSARQLRDIGLSQPPAPVRDNAFANAEAQLGMIR
jgi:hypothetical protein